MIQILKIKKVKFIALFFISILLSTNSFAQKIIEGQAAANLYNGAQMIRTSTQSTIPSYILFNQGEIFDRDGIITWMKKNFNLGLSTELFLIESANTADGLTHYRFGEKIDGITVIDAMWMIHVHNDQVVSMNGLLISDIQMPFSAVLSINDARNKALLFVDAESYKWEFPSEESQLKKEVNNPNSTYFPTGEKIFYPVEAGNTRQYKLAFAFNIYAQNPVGRSWVYIDAITGNILGENKIIHSADTPGTAITAYSGSQNIVSDSFGGGFRLQEVGRGNGIRTFDMGTGTSYGAAVDFTDADNTWNNVNAQLDEYATDAHWGAEMTYDYYLNIHSRNSIDGSGMRLDSYIHYDVGYSNAFWDGTRMTYGDGGGGYSPFTALDIAGHEITHGLTTFTANLNYSDESGALNESFSDIFGTSIEWYARPSNWNWTIGEDIGGVLRSMSDPNAYGDPDTYFGNNWAPLGGADNGGVHTNSSIQNYWFYLLANGGSGTNDIGSAYNITGIGMAATQSITFRNLTVYLTPSSSFSDARFYAIQSAVDLFGACTPEVEATTNAWYAVGVGNLYSPVVIADFNAPEVTSCNAPFTVNFSNLSSNASTFYWDFGDGGNSTATSPSYTYNSLGTFSVSLVADGGTCGTDSIINVSYVTIDTNIACVVNLPTSGTASTQSACAGTIYDSGGSGGNYGPDEDAQITISPVGAATVDIFFPVFDVEPGTSGSCNYDYIQLYDGVNTVAPLIGKYCNNNVPITVSSTGGSITLVFHSDPGLELAGFQADWSCNVPTTPPSVDFVADVDTTCSGVINFTDLSANGPVSWSWDFGDGNTSTVQNPTNTYTGSGLYSVQLTATNSFGSDSITKTNYIYVNLPATPVVQEDSICSGQIGVVTATGSGGILNWYDASVGGTFLDSGNTYTSPPLSSSTTYYVEEETPASSVYFGPIDNTFGGGGYFSGDQHLVFDCYVSVVLKSVLVYANSSGNRTIELRDNTGTILQSATVNIPSGSSRVTLDFTLPVLNNLQLGTAVGSSPDLFRNNTSPTYPYTLAGDVSITSSSAGGNYYYFFYDWEIQEGSCISARVPVTVTVNLGADASIIPVSPLCLSDLPINLTAATSGGLWSGIGITDVNAGIFDPSSSGVGNFNITYTIAGVCGDTQSTIVSVATAYNATIQTIADMCSQDSAQILSAVDANGIWTGIGISDSIAGIFDPSLSGIGSFVIDYSISGSCGDNDTAIVIVNQSSDATIVASGPYCNNDSPQQLSAADSLGQWSANCGTCIDSITGLFNPIGAGIGTWIVYYSFGGVCPDLDSTAIVVSDCSGIQSQVNNPFNVIVFPNPATDEINLSFTGISTKTNVGISLYNMLGQSILKYETELNGNKKMQISLSDVESGIYFLNFISENYSMSVKVVISR